MEWTNRLRCFGGLQSQPLPFETRELAVGGQRVATFLGALGIAQIIEDLGKKVKSLGVFIAVLIVEHVHMQEFPARIFVGGCFEEYLPERVVSGRFGAFVA